MPIEDQVIAKLEPILKEIGYDKVVRVMSRGSVLSTAS